MLNDSSGVLHPVADIIGEFGNFQPGQTQGLEGGGEFTPEGIE
jgi:hypothetical protein